VRKIPVALAILGLAAVGLTGCGIPAGYDSCPRPTSDTSAADLVKVSGETGQKPEVTVRTPFHVDSTSFGDIHEGEGTAISAKNQAVVLDMQIVSGKTGEVLVSTPYDGDLSRVNTYDRWIQAVPAFKTALECATEGTRTVVALAPGGMEAQTAASLGRGGKDSAIAVVDVQKVFLPHAQGSLVYNDALGLPTVVRDPDGRPGIIVPDATAPKDIVAQTLIKGSGPTVGADDTIRVQYTSVSWDDKSVLETTWDSEPAAATLEKLVPGAAKVLGDDITVGSQLLVVLPSSDGSNGASPGVARVFVVDILGVDAAPTK
jgi:peptidylprolyl isomerase